MHSFNESVTKSNSKEKKGTFIFKSNTPLDPVLKRARGPPYIATSTDVSVRVLTLVIGFSPFPSFDASGGRISSRSTTLQPDHKARELGNTTRPENERRMPLNPVAPIYDKVLHANQTQRASLKWSATIFFSNPLLRDAVPK